MRNPCAKRLKKEGESILPAAAALIAALIGLQFCASIAAANDAQLRSLPNETPSAFAFFKEQAEQGIGEAQYNLAVMYETGWSVAVNNQQAVRWFKEAAMQGNTDAQLRLGMLYYLGLGARQSNIKGEKWIRRAAKQGHPIAQKINRLLFKEPLPDGLSAATVLTRVREAYLKDEHSAIAVLESILRQAKRKSERIAERKDDTTMRERRALRSVDGPVKPGFSTIEEVERIDSAVPAFIADASVEENQTLSRGSIATIRLQAEQGLASAQYNLGRMYELGMKVAADKKRAMKWYEKAASQGYADAEYRLGIALFYGAGPTRDEAAGKKWLRSAARHGHPVAQNLVDKFSDHGVAGPQNISLAVRWYLERATAGDREAAFHLGKVLEHGWGTGRDLSAALKWYRLAAQSGNEEARTLATQLQSRLSETKEEVPSGWFVSQLVRYGLPSWLANPLIIVPIIVVVVWPLRSWRKARRQKAQVIDELHEP